VCVQLALLLARAVQLGKHLAHVDQQEEGGYEQRHGLDEDPLGVVAEAGVQALGRHDVDVEVEDGEDVEELGKDGGPPDARAGEEGDDLEVVCRRQGGSKRSAIMGDARIERAGQEVHSWRW
jgi:hypothetical protein